jgi:hypothetical protein
MARDDRNPGVERHLQSKYWANVPQPTAMRSPAHASMNGPRCSGMIMSVVLFGAMATRWTRPTPALLGSADNA